MSLRFSSVHRLIFVDSPNECDLLEIRNQVEHLAALMSESKFHPQVGIFLSDLTDTLVPGKRYALTLQVMLKRFKKRKSHSTSRSPKIARGESHRSMAMVVEHPTGAMPYSPVYDQSFTSPDQHMPPPAHPAHQSHSSHMVLSQGQMPPQQPQQLYATDAENIWRGFEATANEQLPVWISDQTLGGNTFTQNGMDAFLLPPDYLPPTPQIW